MVIPWDMNRDGSFAVTEVVGAKPECQSNRPLDKRAAAYLVLQAATATKFASILLTWLIAKECWILGLMLSARLLLSDSLTSP